VVVEGRTWEVRLNLLTTAPFSEELMARQRPPSQRWRPLLAFWTFYETGGVGATLVVDDESPGEAADRGIKQLVGAATAEGVPTTVLQEVVVVPAWRDERDWSPPA